MSPRPRATSSSPPVSGVPHLAASVSQRRHSLASVGTSTAALAVTYFME